MVWPLFFWAEYWYNKYNPGIFPGGWNVVFCVIWGGKYYALYSYYNQCFRFR